MLRAGVVKDEGEEEQQAALGACGTSKEQH